MDSLIVSRLIVAPLKCVVLCGPRFLRNWQCCCFAFSFTLNANTRGLLPKVLRALAAHVPDSRTEMIAGATHAMFEQAPQKYCEIVLDFLAR
jgi:hypothetical protein